MPDITKEKNKHKTPAGGEYSEVYYFDSQWNSIDKKLATYVVIRELDKNGNLIFETWGDLPRRR